MKHSIKSAQLHNPVDIRGFITKKTISTAELKDSRLFFDELGLHVHFKGGIIIIPGSNVAAVSLSDEQKSK